MSGIWKRSVNSDIWNAASPLRAPMPHARNVTMPTTTVTLPPTMRRRVGMGRSTTLCTTNTSSVAGVSGGVAVAVMTSPVPALGQLADAARACRPQPEDAADQRRRRDEQHDHRLDDGDDVVRDVSGGGHRVAAGAEGAEQQSGEDGAERRAAPEQRDGDRVEAETGVDAVGDLRVRAE